MLAPDNGVHLALRNCHKSEHALTAVVALSRSISQLFSQFKFDFLARCCLPFCSPSAALQLKRPFLCRCTVIPESLELVLVLGRLRLLIRMRSLGLAALLHVEPLSCGLSLLQGFLEVFSELLGL
jgi:hypothetical protein